MQITVAYVICNVQAKVLCTRARAKIIVVALAAGAASFTSSRLAETNVIFEINLIMCRLVAPAAVLVVNVLVVREVRRRTSSDAANSLGLQHTQSVSSNSVVPTIMLLATSFVYLLLCSTTSILYVVGEWILNPSFSQDVLCQCEGLAHALSLIAFGYNFYVYLITGKQFRSELHKLLCSRSGSAAASADVNIARRRCQNETAL